MQKVSYIINEHKKDNKKNTQKNKIFNTDIFYQNIHY